MLPLRLWLLLLSLLPLLLPLVLALISLGLADRLVGVTYPQCE
jgi:hypothetical protein